ncbi:MAG: Slp family lipoprotein [Nitrospirota bacterium]
MCRIWLNRTLCFLALCLAVGCSPVPRQYLREAAPNVTLSSLAEAPQTYQGRLVVMGAVIVKEETRDGDLWLHVKNRPLDEDYRPQLPPSTDDPEGGWYWVVVGNHQTFPASHHHWADMTVVGRVTGLARDHEPILKMVYVRGWGITSAHDGVWENVVDMNYVPSFPAGIHGELGPQ